MRLTGFSTPGEGFRCVETPKNPTPEQDPCNAPSWGYPIETSYERDFMETSLAAIPHRNVSVASRFELGSRRVIGGGFGVPRKRQDGILEGRGNLTTARWAAAVSRSRGGYLGGFSGVAVDATFRRWSDPAGGVVSPVDPVPSLGHPQRALQDSPAEIRVREPVAAGLSDHSRCSVASPPPGCGPSALSREAA